MIIDKGKTALKRYNKLEGSFFYVNNIKYYGSFGKLIIKNFIGCFSIF